MSNSTIVSRPNISHKFEETEPRNRKMEDKIEPTSGTTIYTFESTENTDVEDVSTPTLDGEPNIEVDQGDTDNRTVDKEREFSAVYDNKRKELDKIQDDLNELMDRLNTFIADSQDELGDSADEESVTEQQTYDDDLSEKQDGPQEKELMKQKFCNGFPIDDMYSCDGMNPPEVNWDTLAPFIQNVVGDLKRIRNLNLMTNSVLQRIRTITGNTNSFSNSE